MQGRCLQFARLVGAYIMQGWCLQSTWCRHQGGFQKQEGWCTARLVPTLRGAPETGRLVTTKKVVAETPLPPQDQKKLTENPYE
eukprot:3100321-Amphidinium_carterae.9